MDVRLRSSDVRRGSDETPPATPSSVSGGGDVISAALVTAVSGGGDTTPQRSLWYSAAATIGGESNTCVCVCVW